MEYLKLVADYSELDRLESFENVENNVINENEDNARGEHFHNSC